MEIKVNDYVRTKSRNGFTGGIAKIEKIEFDKKHNINWLTLDRALDHISFLEMSSNVVKTSSKIIDLIEIGDYVNGKLVIDTFTDYIFDYSEEFKVIRFSETDILHNTEHIKSIVTKEQFEKMEYKVNE